MNSQMNSIISKLENRQANILGHEHFFKSSVMLPLIKKDGDVYILFEVRSMEMKRQPGEICFPGGRVDVTDLNEEYTAKRELCEELGLQFSDIKTIAPLDILVTPFRGIIYPFVGEILHPHKIKPNKSEVSETFVVPLDFLKNTRPETFKMNVYFEPSENFPIQSIPNQQYYKRRSYQTTEYFYYYKNYVIWGLTGRILRHFLELMKEVEE